ncbi:hypothetical protein SRABI133_03660 [Peribacillus simplex]|uniref:Uncharacterized protein n=1 Tax=Peribacillus simplex TaxID=1478 RepID=A0A9W4PGX7_9BACI|nr:hypothetical protein SRABI133_03660 [Peribacillus simplex]
MDPLNIIHHDDWKINMLNLPSNEQVDFLFKFCIEETLIEEVENNRN